MNNFYKGAVIIVASAFGYSLLPIFALFAYRGNITVTTLLIFRFLLGSIVFFAYIFIKYKGIHIRKKELLYLFILGGICYNLQARCYFTSVKYIPASLTSLLLYTYPMIVTILSFIFDKEKVTKTICASIGISFLGLVLILGTSYGKINGVGVLLALGSAMVYSIYIIIGNRVLKTIQPIVASAFIALFSSIGVFVLGLFTNSVSFNFKAATWGPIIGLVMFATVLAMLCFFKGMELLGPSKASILSMTEPVFTIILMTLIFKDRLTVMQLIGGIAVLAGSVLIIWSKDKAIKEEEPLEIIS